MVTRIVKSVIEYEVAVCPICNEDNNDQCMEFCVLCRRSDIHARHFVAADKRFELGLILDQHCTACQGIADQIFELVKDDEVYR